MLLFLYNANAKAPDFHLIKSTCLTIHANASHRTQRPPSCQTRFHVSSHTSLRRRSLVIHVRKECGLISALNHHQPPPKTSAVYGTVDRLRRDLHIIRSRHSSPPLTHFSTSLDSSTEIRPAPDNYPRSVFSEKAISLEILANDSHCFLHQKNKKRFSSSEPATIEEFRQQPTRLPLATRLKWPSCSTMLFMPDAHFPRLT